MNTKSILQWTNTFFPTKIKYEKEGTDHFYTYVQSANVEMPFRTLFEIFRGIPHLRAVIERKASMVSNVRPVVQFEDTDEVDYKHPLNRSLEHPNVFQSWKQMMYMLSIYKSVAGVAFLLPGHGITDKARHLAYLKPVDFETYKIVKYKDKLAITTDNIDEFIKRIDFQFANNLEVDFKASELLWFRDTYYNYTESSSRITSLMPNLKNIYKALIARGILMDRRGGMGILSGGQKDGGVAVPWKPNEKEDLEKELDNYGTGEGKKSIFVTNVPLNFQPMVFPTKDLKLFEEIKDDFDTICDTYGMNREIFFGETEYANKEQAMQGTYTDTIVPEWDDIFSMFNKQLKVGEEGRKLVPDYSHIRHLAENMKEKVDVDKTKSEMHLKELAANVIDLAEYRDLMEYEPRPDLEAAREERQLQTQQTIDVNAEVVNGDQKQLAQQNKKENETK